MRKYDDYVANNNFYHLGNDIQNVISENDFDMDGIMDALRGEED